MENVQNICDISKETLTFLAFFEDKLIKKIPSYVIIKLCEEAADSKLDFYIDSNKSFKEQIISERTKDLIALIYYDYIAEEEEKKEILKQWNLNEENYQNTQKEKYNYNKIFKNKETTDSLQLIEIKEDTIFQKIKKLLKKYFKRENY